MCPSWHVMTEVSSVFSLLLCCELCEEIKTVPCVVGFILNHGFEMKVTSTQTGFEHCIRNDLHPV